MLNTQFLIPSLIFAIALPFSAMSASAESKTSLFDRLGGMHQINDIVSKTIDRTSKDERTKRSFEGIKLAPVKESVAQHLCEISGGPCKYEGASMAKAHSGLAITAREFDIMDDYLAQELTAHGISAADKAELQSLLGPLKPEIIEK